MCILIWSCSGCMLEPYLFTSIWFWSFPWKSNAIKLLKNAKYTVNTCISLAVCAVVNSGNKFNLSYPHSSSEIMVCKVSWAFINLCQVVTVLKYYLSMKNCKTTLKVTDMTWKSPYGSGWFNSIHPSMAKWYY